MIQSLCEAWKEGLCQSPCNEIQTGKIVMVQCKEGKTGEETEKCPLMSCLFFLSQALPEYKIAGTGF